MYLTAERLALANREIRETFERTSIAWQAIPHWETGDPAQTRVPNANLTFPAFENILPQEEPFQLTVAQATAPTPDSVLAVVIAHTVKLAKKVDDDVLTKLYAAGAPAVTAVGAAALQNTLIGARAKVENAGYRAPACLVTNLGGLEKLSLLVGGTSMLQQFLYAANANSLHRAQQLDGGGDANTRLLLVGRRQRIAPGSAADGVPGGEPVDLAVSVGPSLEIVGETATGTIELSVRIRYATRIKDPSGLASRYNP